MLTYMVDNSLRLSVGFDRYDGDRWGYGWEVNVDGLTFHGSDLRGGSTPMDSPHGLGEMLCALASFLGAFLDDESSDTFPAGLRDALSGVSSDDLAMVEMDVMGRI